MALDFENFNNSRQIYIVSFILSLSKDYLSKRIDYWMLLTKIKFI